MAITTTQPLTVTRVNPTTVSSPLVGFTMTPAPNLFISNIQITRTTTPGVSGTITPGSAASPTGSATISMETTAYADMRALAKVPCKVILHYDTATFHVVQVDIQRSYGSALILPPHQPTI